MSCLLCVCIVYFVLCILFMSNWNRVSWKPEPHRAAQSFIHLPIIINNAWGSANDTLQSAWGIDTTISETRGNPSSGAQPQQYGIILENGGMIWSWNNVNHMIPWIWIKEQRLPTNRTMNGTVSGCSRTVSRHAIRHAPESNVNILCSPTAKIHGALLLIFRTVVCASYCC